MAGVELLLEGKTALVTGGSRGIGAETVRLFRAAGARVAFSYRQAAERARALEAELGAKEQAAPATMDLSPGMQTESEEAIEQAAEASAEETKNSPWGPQSAGFRGRPMAPSKLSNLRALALGGSDRGLRERESFGQTTSGDRDTGALRGTPLGRGLSPGAEARATAGGDAGGLKSRPLGNFYEDLSGTIRVIRDEDSEVAPNQNEGIGSDPSTGSLQSREASAQGTATETEALCVGIEQELETAADGRALVEKAVTALGRLDILVVNHGIWPAEDAPIATMTEAQWRRTMGVNLDAVFGLVQGAIAQFERQRQGPGTRDRGSEEQGPRDQGNEGAESQGQRDQATEGQGDISPKKDAAGHIVLISSTAGQRGEAFHADYAASKGALISLTKSLSSELAPKGIRVNCVAPGWVETDMSAGTLGDPEQGAKVRAGIPVGRVATPREIAGPVLFLCTPLAGFISGEVLNVNGGAVLVG